MHWENNEREKFNYKQLKLTISFGVFSAGVQQAQTAGHFHGPLISKVPHSLVK